MTYTLAAFGLNLVYFVIAVAVGWAVLRGLDRLTRLSFREWYSDARKSDAHLPISIYFAARFIGICTVAAAFLS